MPASVLSSTAWAFAAVLALAILAAPTVAAAAAQKPVSADQIGLAPEQAVAGWISPRVNVPLLLQEDAANAGRWDIPYRIGYAMEPDLSPATAGTWEDLPEGGRLWRVRITTENALWVVLGFDIFRLEADSRMWVYDPARKTVMGPYTVRDVRDHGQLWVPPIETDTLIVELHWPEALRYVEPKLHLGTVSHGYKPFGSIGRGRLRQAGGIPTEGFGDAGPCNIDVMCPLGANWQDQKRGVVMLLTSGGTGFCSGSLINTTADDCRPYVLTAAHCGAGVSTMFGFNFERPACSSGVPPPATTQSVAGATVLASYSSTDFTLLQMSASPPESFNAYFAGWSRLTTPATTTHCIHHPRADAKKITRDADAPTNGINWGANHWRIAQWEDGTTEPGSSGSPLYDQNKRIVGQLHGGTASCTSITWDEFGKVDASWTGGGTSASRLSNWLDPENTGAMVMDGVDWSTCAFNPVGQIAFTRSVYACSDTLTITLRDDSLRGLESQTVTVTSNTETSPETVTLTVLAPGAGQFQGTFPVSTVPPARGDGQLSVSPGDTITVTYIDADDGQGGQNIPRTATASVDCVGPAITNVRALNVTGHSADIAWVTDELANSVVRYGLEPPGGSTASSAALVSAHSVRLTGLAECSRYYFWVQSADAAGNASSNDNNGAYFTFETQKNVNPTYSYAGAPVPIPDNNPTGASASLSVTDVNTIVNVKVRVNITHTYDGDLTLSLIGPDGTSVVLSNRRGGSGDNFTNTVFDDSATTPISSGTAPFTGSFRPDAPLSAFIGRNPTGTWTFKVVDSAGIDVGTIDGFDLMLSYPPQACGPSVQYLSSTKVEACNGTGSGGGNGTIDPGETVSLTVTARNNGTSAVTGVSGTLTSLTPGVAVVSGTAAYPDLAAGASAPSGSGELVVQVDAGFACGASINLGILFTANEGSWSDAFSLSTGTPTIGTNTYPSTDVPRPLPDLSTTTSSLTVTNTGTVQDVDVTLSLTHTFDGDLVITLIGPNGTRVVLSNRRGGSGDNFTNTVFDDQATTPISSGAAPFTGRFRPDEPLSALNGIPANGVWKLEIRDAAAADTGTLQSWSVTLTTSAAPTCLNCAPALAGEAPNLRWAGTDKQSLEWDSAANATSYSLYRGDAHDLPNLLNDGPDSCHRMTTAGLGTGPVLTENPVTGGLYWYLVRGLNATGLGPAGHATAGPRIQDSYGACP